MKYRIKIHTSTGDFISDEINADDALSVKDVVSNQKGFYMPMTGNIVVVGENVVKNSIIEFMEIRERNTF